MDPRTLLHTTMNYKLHCFRPGETIDAVIRLLGRHNLTHEELLPLRQAFNELNGFAAPRVGETFKIPLPTEPSSTSEDRPSTTA